MSAFARAKTVAEIAEIGARIYGIVVDKRRAAAEQKRKIKELEAQVAELKQKVGAK
jgi:ribosomal protein L13E